MPLCIKYDTVGFIGLIAILFSFLNIWEYIACQKTPTSCSYSHGNPVTIISTVHKLSSVPLRESEHKSIIYSENWQTERINWSLISQWLSLCLLCLSGASLSLCSRSWAVCRIAIPSSAWSSSASRTAPKSETERSDRRRERWSSSGTRTR